MDVTCPACGKAMKLKAYLDDSYAGRCGGCRAWVEVVIDNQTGDRTVTTEKGGDGDGDG
jgi:hypothetical protein